MRIVIFEVGRDARTGRFISVRRARKHPTISVVQTIRRRVKRHPRVAQASSLRPAQ